MEIYTAGKAHRKIDFSPKIAQQTGFPSAATHYSEPSIDLNKELIVQADATFFVRINGAEWKGLNIHDKDVLIIDRSLKPHFGNLAIIVQDGGFKIIKVPKHSAQEWQLWGVITYIIHNAQ